jgi:hypothetical protein
MDHSLGTIVSYKWEFGDGFGGIGTNAIHQYSKAGTYTVKLTVTDSQGRVSIAQVIITIDEGPDYGVERGESGFMVKTPYFSFEWNAAISAMLGIVCLIVSIGTKKVPILTPKRLQILGVVLLVAGLAFYVM